MPEHRKKQTLIGTVISDKMEKTVNVRVLRKYPIQFIEKELKSIKITLLI